MNSITIKRKADRVRRLSVLSTFILTKEIQVKQSSGKAALLFFRLQIYICRLWIRMVYRRHSYLLTQIKL